VSAGRIEPRGAAAASVPGGLSAERAVLLLIGISALCRLVLAAQLGLSVDESYSVAISRRFALSYFDHPPLHVWLVGAWARLLGTEASLALRVPDIVLFAGSTWLMYRLTALVYGVAAGVWAALALNLAPVFTLNAAGGIVPDGPMVFFALLALYCFVRAMSSPPPPRRALAWWFGAGAAAGLALLSKYLAIFTILSLAFCLLTCRPRRLREGGPWLAAFLIVLLFLPVLIWNHSHEWASFAFQGGRARPAGLSLGRAAVDFAGQLLYLLPWSALALLYVLVRAMRGGPRDEATWLFVWLSAPAIMFFALAGLWTTVLPHWPAIGWLFGLPLLGSWLAAIAAQRPRLVRRIAFASAALLVSVIALGVTQARTGWLDEKIPALAGADPTLDFLDWRELKYPVARHRAQDPDLVVATVSWIDAGKVSYALGGDEVPVLCLSSDAREFGFLYDEQPWRGRTLLIIADGARKDWLQLATPRFVRIEPLEDVQLTRAGKAALTLHTAWGYGFRPRVGLP